uniref:Uncharacterized protein n=1 Tax=Gorilla gorilla gorilla TaxID=9595 RepID=A0A2I2Y9G3_GORGO
MDSQISPSLGSFQDHCMDHMAMVTVVLASPLSSNRHLIYPTDILTSPPGCFEGNSSQAATPPITSDNCSGTRLSSLCRPGHRPHPPFTTGARVSFSNCRSD